MRKKVIEAAILLLCSIALGVCLIALGALASSVLISMIGMMILAVGSACSFMYLIEK